MEIERQYQQLLHKLEHPQALAPQELHDSFIMAAELGVVVKIWEIWQKASRELSEIEQMAIDVTIDRELLSLAAQEAIEIELQIADLEDRLKVALLPQDPDDRRDVIIEITAGTGGDESGLWVEDLMRLYVRYAENGGWRTRMVNESYAELGGFKNVFLEIKGDRPYSYLKFESGIHELQRLPITLSSRKVHTSTATVRVMPEVDEWEYHLNPEDLELYCHDRFQGFPRGNTNAVTFYHKPTRISVFSDIQRHQRHNKELALQVLRTKLYAVELQKQQESVSSYLNLTTRDTDLLPLIPHDRDKIRIYNYPENRIIDRRLATQFDLSEVFSDGIAAIVRACLDRDLSDRILELENPVLND